MIDITPYQSSVGYKKITTAPETQDFITKLLDDGELTDQEKEKFLFHVNNYSSPPHKTVKEYCEAYFRNGKKFIGRSDYTNNPRSRFIRIKDIPRFKSWIAEIVSSDVTSTLDELLDVKTAPNIKKMLFDQLMDTPIREDIVNDTKNSQYYLGIDILSASTKAYLREAKTDPWMVWSFPFQDGDELNINNLDCRAGLSENKNEDKVVYKHNVDECKKLKRPTVFDAEFYVQFRPNGKTKPLEECEDEEGFDEYVHDPNKFKHIVEPPLYIKKKI